MAKLKDKYDRAIEYFNENSETIYTAWVDPSKHHYGYLFDYCASGPSIFFDDCGCPSMVAHDREKHVFFISMFLTCFFEIFLVDV